MSFFSQSAIQLSTIHLLDLILFGVEDGPEFDRFVHPWGKGLSGAVVDNGIDIGDQLVDVVETALEFNGVLR